jgi:4-hydroxy-tetrahydrodipicolinate synthase
MAAMVDAFNAKNMKKAKELHYKMTPLIDALFIETNPVPVKAALFMMGKIQYEVRMPLSRLSDANYEKLKKVMETYGLIK